MAMPRDRDFLRDRVSRILNIQLGERVRENGLDSR